jgi:pimeloyl-ACP methyl ester carboxylesterase
MVDMLCFLFLLTWFRKRCMCKAEAAIELKIASPNYSGSGRVGDGAVLNTCGSITIRRSRGNGMPVLFISSEASSHEDAFTDLFTDGVRAEYDVVSMEISPYELPATYNLGYELTRLVDSVLLVVEACDIDYAAIIGHSFGCLVALELAAYFRGAIAIGLSKPPVRDLINWSSSTSSTERSMISLKNCYVLDSLKEQLGPFLRRADKLYRHRVAEPMVWYGG